MSDAETGIIAAIAAAGGVALGHVVKLVGSRKERAEADSMDSTSGERVATLALEALAVERETTQQHRTHRDDCEERLREMSRRLDDEVRQLRGDIATVQGHMTAIREEHARCPSQDEYDRMREDHVRLSRELVDARRFVDALRSDSTLPPDSEITGAHVRAAEETDS